MIFQQKHADDVKYRNVSMGGGCCRALVGGFGLGPETKGDVDQQRIYTAAYRCRSSGRVTAGLTSASGLRSSPVLAIIPRQPFSCAIGIGTTGTAETDFN